MALCGVCGDAILLWFRVPNTDATGLDALALLRGELFNTEPKPPAALAPEATQEEAARLYIQALKVFRQGHFDACAPTFRRALEVALKDLAPEIGNGVPLIKRIEALPPAKGLTPAMKAWAHEVRLIGNEGAHGDGPVSKEDAQDIQAFTELFLTYAYTLPARLAARKRREAES